MSYDNKQLRCYDEMVSRVQVQRKLKEESDIHSCIRKKEIIYCTVKHICAHPQTREKERERQTDGKRERRLMEHVIVVRCIMIIVWPASKGEG